MKALVHNGVAKFLLEDTDTIEAHGSGIIILTSESQPDLIVGDISFGEIEEVLDVNLPDFVGGKYAYDGENFTVIEV